MAVNGREGWRRRAALRNAPPGLHSGQPDPTLVARPRATTTLVERKLPQTLWATHLEVDAASRKPCTLTAMRAGKFCSERTPRYAENPHSPAGWGFRDGQAAIIYSLIESCRLVRIDPFVYLRDVLVRVATHPDSRVEELIPARWSQLFAASRAS